MKKLLIFIFYLFSSSIYAETYFCQYPITGGKGLTSKTIYERVDTDIFISKTGDGWTGTQKIVSETSNSLYLMGAFRDNPPGVSLKIIDKNTKKFAVTFLSAGGSSKSSEPAFGDCIVN